MSVPRPYLRHPFIHSAQFIIGSNFSTYMLSPLFGTFKCVLVRCRFVDCTCVLAEILISISEPLFKSCHVPYGHKIDGIYACAFDEQIKSFISSCRPI